MCTPAMQRYLAAIFRLKQVSPTLSVSALAHYLDVSLPAVSSMIRRMETRQLVEHSSRYDLTLTLKGKQQAIPVVRRYLLAEVYLVDVMGFSWEEAHTLADKFVHGIDQSIEDRIDELTEFPSHTHRGEPIPTRDGELPVIDDTCLVDLEPGDQGIISRIHLNDPDKLRYLGDLGLMPNTLVGLVEAAPFEGPITLRCGECNCVLSYEMARSIRVCSQD
jgi:DtxR family Mn-dependent transcriptional regulator